MEVSKEEILHIAELANLKLKDEEISEYLKNLQDILNFANIVNKAPVVKRTPLNPPSDSAIISTAETTLSPDGC